METSPTIKSLEIKKKLLDEGKQVYNLGLGENPMPGPIDLKKTIIEKANLKHYTNAKGIDEIRQKLNTENVIVGNGLKPLIYLTQLAFSKLYPEGTIFHIIPYWTSYHEQIKHLNINYVEIPCNNKWKVTYNGLDKALKNASYPRLVIFNNPNNPSGCIYNETELHKLSKIFNKYKCLIFSDEIYNKLVYKKYTNEYGSISNYCSDTIIASSLSKNWACGGYRFGWLKYPKTIINEDLRKLYKYSLNLASSIYTCPSIIMQHVGVEALTLNNNIQNQISFTNDMFETVNSFCHEKLEKMNIKCSNTKACWYKLLNFNYYKKKLNKKNIYNSNELVNALLNELNIICVSGDSFGIKKPLIIRISMIDIKVTYNSYLTNGNNYDFINIRKCLEMLENWLSNL